jgi:hypothetical protein
MLSLFSHPIVYIATVMFGSMALTAELVNSESVNATIQVQEASSMDVG